MTSSQVQQFVFMSLRMMIRAPIMAIGGIIMAVAQDARLSLIFRRRRSRSWRLYLRDCRKGDAAF